MSMEIIRRNRTKIDSTRDFRYDLMSVMSCLVRTAIRESKDGFRSLECRVWGRAARTPLLRSCSPANMR